MKKFIIKVSILCFFFTLISNILPFSNTLVELHAKASQKATLKETGGTMGRGTWPIVIQINNAKYGATYTFTPEDKALVSISEQEEQAVVYPTEKIGKTTITVKEVYEGKTTIVGVYTVTIVRAQLQETKLEIGCSGYNTIPILYQNTNATYTYKSADPSIAKVSKDGYITGVKYGKTKITVTESYMGKAVEIGTCSITVAKSRLAVKQLDMPIYIGIYDSIPIACRNDKATYQYSSSNAKVVKVDKYGYYSGLKQGKATITVTETLNKVSRKLGTMTINVVLSSIDSTKQLVLGLNSKTSYYELIEGFETTILIFYRNESAKYTFESADPSIITIETEVSNWGEENLFIKGVGCGVTTLKVFEEYESKIRTVGTVNVEVRDYPVSVFAFKDTGERTKDGIVIKSFNIGGPYDLSFSYSIRPYNCTTPIIVTSNDESIVSVDSEGWLTVLKAGEVEITATCGEFIDKIIIRVIN